MRSLKAFLSQALGNSISAYCQFLKHLRHLGNMRISSPSISLTIASPKLQTSLWCAAPSGRVSKVDYSTNPPFKSSNWTDDHRRQNMIRDVIITPGKCNQSQEEHSIRRRGCQDRNTTNPTPSSPPASTPPSSSTPTSASSTPSTSPSSTPSSSVSIHNHQQKSTKIFSRNRLIALLVVLCFKWQ